MLDAREPLVAALLRLFRVLRLDRGMTIEQLADAAFVHRTTVGLLERGERTPSVEVASQVAKALGYPLSELLAKAELIADGKLAQQKAFEEEKARHIEPALLRNAAAFQAHTGMPSAALPAAIQGCYHTLDMIDDQLVSRGSPPIAQLVELANLSSMIGNLVGGCLADESGGLYQRNKPHHYPDLLPLTHEASPLELKVALETNKPKGHLPKPGRYITFRYVLGDRSGNYVRGKPGRGPTVWFWEVKVGDIAVHDFAISNTEGDSGKTAVVRTPVFNAMPVVYFDPKFCPHPLRAGTYPGFN